MKLEKLDYKKSGVDVEAGENLVGWLKSQKPKSGPHQDRIVNGIGGFAALFRVGFPEMKSPCLVSSTDGVGTKLMLASEMESYTEVAQDLVAMCVNDLICCGATPLFFLDYYASGKLRLEAAKSFLGGVQKACTEAQCALIGGETAELPGLYQNKDFDCAGFSVGIVDEEKALGAHKVKGNEALVAVGSSGFHSNGFSLIRKVFQEDMEQWKEILLRPTHLYVRLVQSLLKEGDGIRAIANVTGGGLNNLPRVLPPGTHAQLIPWEIPEPFLEVKKRAKLDLKDLLTTLNCGLGMIFVVDPAQKDSIIEGIQSQGFNAISMGNLVSGASPKDLPYWSVDEELWKTN